MKILKFFIVLLFTTTIYSQTNNNSQIKPFIEVTGTAETEVIPDEIYLNICIKERMEKGKKLTIKLLESDLKNHLKLIGIPEENISISDVNAVLAKTGWWKEEVFSVANYTLKVNGAGKLKKLFESFKKLKISEVSITKATHSNIIELRKKNRIKAIKIAKEKSDYLLSAIGEKTGKPIMINEISNNHQQNFANVNFFNNTNSKRLKSVSVVGYGAQKETVQFEKIKISSSIYVKFQIK